MPVALPPFDTLLMAAAEPARGVPWPLMALGFLVVIMFMGRALARNVSESAGLARDAASAAFRGLGALALAVVGLVVIFAVTFGSAGADPTPGVSGPSVTTVPEPGPGEAPLGGGSG